MTSARCSSIFGEQHIPVRKYADCLAPYIKILKVTYFTDNMETSASRRRISALTQSAQSDTKIAVLCSTVGLFGTRRQVVRSRNIIVGTDSQVVLCREFVLLSCSRVNWRPISKTAPPASKPTRCSNYSEPAQPDFNTSSIDRQERPGERTTLPCFFLGYRLFS